MSTQRSVADMIGETTSLLCVVAFYGPPVVFFAAPWLVLTLMLMGPFTLLLTLAAAILAAGVLLAAVAIVLASAIALLRRLAQRQLAPKGKALPVSDAAPDSPHVRHRRRQPLRAARGTRTARA